MKITGIITEYNPFHKGHLYHLQQAKKITDCDCIVCVMNGNFMQRGKPAITDKWSRTKMALNNGVDIVLELPLVYGIRSAEHFARGAVLTLAGTGIVDYIVFGSEAGSINPLKKIASTLIKEPEYYKSSLQKYLSKGLSFPAAREKALRDYYRLSSSTNNFNSIIDAVNTPNNILGIEYLKILQKHKIKIKPYTIKRKGSGYHSSDTMTKFMSASAIREQIYSQQNILNIKDKLPAAAYKYLQKDIKEQKIPIRKDYLGILILNKLRQISVQNLSNYTTKGSGLEMRINEYAFSSGTLSQLIENIKTKAYTWTGIERILLHVLFELNLDTLNFIDKNGLQYLRILGFNKKGENMLSKINQKSSLPLITQPADYLNTANSNSKDPLVKMLSYDLIASDLYTLLYKNPSKRKGHLDFYNTIIKL